MTAGTSLEALHHEYGSKATAVEPGRAEPIAVGGPARPAVADVLDVSLAEPSW